LEQGTQIDRRPPTYPNYIETCDDNVDNDGDNKIDCYDPECHEEVCKPGYICNYDIVKLNEEVLQDKDTICDEKTVTSKLNEIVLDAINSRLIIHDQLLKDADNLDNIQDTYSLNYFFENSENNQERSFNDIFDGEEDLVHAGISDGCIFDDELISQDIENFITKHNEITEMVRSISETSYQRAMAVIESVPRK
jgi:hypothetical protein